jgi:hypothetical protein
MNKQQIDKRIYRFTKTNASSYPIDQMTDDENVAMDRVASLIMKADARWQFDDTNETDLPIATTDIVAGQEDYSLETAHLDVTMVRVKYPDGTWHTLDPIDQADILDSEIGQTGLPTKYDKLGTSIFPLPIPNYDLDDAIELHFKRGPSYFLTTDTTKSPGFNALYHDLIALWPAYDFALRNLPNLATGYFNAIQLKEDALVNDYANRAPDKIVMRTRTESSR